MTSEEESTATVLPVLETKKKNQGARRVAAVL